MYGLCWRRGIGLVWSSLLLRIGVDLAGDGGLQELDAHAVGAALDDDGVLLHRADRAGDAADGGDIVAHGQGVPHLLFTLFPLVLRPDQEKVHKGQHQDDHN